MFFLCLCLFFPSVFTYEVTTKPSSSENMKNIFDLPNNITVSNTSKLNDNQTIVTHRITQPLQTQNIERILETHASRNGSVKLENKTSTLDNFKPSPQLETYYEYNKFPVVPAFPEAKTFGGFSNLGYSSNNWEEKPAPGSWSNNQGFHNSWYDNSKKHNPNPTTESPWTTRVKFPSPTVNENPYKFVGNDDILSSYHPPVSFPTTTEGFAFNKPVESPNRNINNKSPLGLWQKLMGSVNNVDKNAVAVQKTFLDYNLMEKPPHYSNSVKEHDSGISSYGSSSSLKKIIKLLTAIIPIGLFISALTPTVITVTSTNDTQSRYRIDDPNHQSVANRLASVASSLKYAEQLRSCEDKILCELLVTASVSKNSEEHIKNLLDTFSEHEDLQSKREDLLKVFEAVKKEDCSSVVCKSKKNPS